MSVAFIFTSGCVTDDSSSYTPPSAPPDIVLTPAPSNDPIIGGYTDFTNKDRRSAYPPPADDSSSYTPPAPAPTNDYSSNWRNTPEGERISLGTATDEDKAVAVSQGADPNNVGLPPAPTPTQPTNMAQVIAQQMANAESQGLTLETVPVPSSEQTTHN